MTETKLDREAVKAHIEAIRSRCMHVNKKLINYRKIGDFTFDNVETTLYTYVCEDCGKEWVEEESDGWWNL